MSALAHEESEYRTRRQRIDPMLEAQGWNVVAFDPAQPLSDYAHHALTEFPTDNGPADYALVAAGQLLGISLGPEHLAERRHIREAKRER